MAEYIEKDQMHDILAGQFCACSDEVEETINAIWAEVRSLPAANVRENVKGEWVWFGDCSNAGLYCSVCRNKIHKVKTPKKKMSNFCPNCGASMRDVPDANVVKSHGDEIRAMSDEELANLMACTTRCRYCPVKESDGCSGGYHNCVDIWLDWLRQEAEE